MMERGIQNEKRTWILGSSRSNYCSSDTSFSLLNVKLTAIPFIISVFNEIFLKGGLLGVRWVFFRNHFNDFLAGIILIAYTNLILGFYKNKTIRVLKFRDVMGYMLIVGLFWEFVTPIYWKSSVSDWWDLVSYLCGALVYYVVIKLKMKK